MISLKDGFTIWRQSQKEDLLSIYINVLVSMMYGRGPNPIFFDKEKIARPEHSPILHSLRPITSHFCLTPVPPPQNGRHMCINTKYIWRAEE